MGDTEATEPLPFSDDLSELALLGLEHGIETIREGGPFVTFALLERDGERAIQHITAENPEESLEAARHAISEADDGTVERAVIAFDGFMTFEGEERTDAVFAVGHERGTPSSFVFAQPYRPRGEGAGVEPVGSPAVVGADEEPLLRTS